MKLWGGRFEKATDGMVDDFHSSISFDKRLIRQDIAGSIAHAAMLGEAGVIEKADAERIVAGLQAILDDFAAGKLDFPAEAEDIHMYVEALLTEKIGEAGKRLHTGRSRNDQVALDARMYAKAAIEEAQALLRDLMAAIVAIAKENLAAVMPGYTHLQRAQPITLAHHMMAWFQMLRRDHERLSDCRKRADEMPLGSGALAGTTYPLDREMVARQLGFSRITQNSLDGVSDRDFMLEYLSAASISMMHLSRMCEEMILWSSAEFRFVEMDDAFATGSSIMPQKKNPDVAELARGKTGRVFGGLMALLTMIKGLPLAYNKDMQEDKEQIFDAVDTVKAVLPVFSKMLVTMKVKKDVMLRAAKAGFVNATDLADYLAARGVPFRDAHEISGKMVAFCAERGTTLENLSLDVMQTFSPVFAQDVYAALQPAACVNRRRLVGGPAVETVRRAIERARKEIN